MCVRTREFDWSKTPLGPLDRWSERLRATVSMCLKFQLPMGIGWGPDLIFLYNDACIPILGPMHPQALGHSYRECFPELTDPRSDDLLMVLERSGYLIHETTAERYRTFF